MVVSDNNQLQKFENDDVAQYYFEILRQLIAKKIDFCTADWVSRSSKLSRQYFY